MDLDFIIINNKISIKNFKLSTINNKIFIEPYNDKKNNMNVILYDNPNILQNHKNELINIHLNLIFKNVEYLLYSQKQTLPSQ